MSKRDFQGEAGEFFGKLERLLSSLLRGRFQAHPDFKLLVDGCRNRYVPAIRCGLDRLMFERPDQYPLSLRQSLLELSGSLKKRDLEKAVKRADFALTYARQIGFAPRHRRLENQDIFVPPPTLPLPKWE